MKRTTARARTLLVACCVLAGCSRDDPPSAQAVAEEVAEETADTVFTPAERVTLPPGRIYYTLTDHAWYARGEPLVHEGRPWVPAGMPVDASLPEMSLAGEFQGVEYYVRSGEPEAALYVPVFEGYWQVFRPDTTGRTPAPDTAGAGD